jgi:HK97 family phage major capsid protein
MPETLTLDEKKAQAQALLAEVKEAAAKGGGDDGEDYAAHVKKFQTAQALMTEVKAEKNESERKELLTLLEAFEKQTTAPAGTEDAGIVSGAKSRLAELEEKNAKRTDADADIEALINQRVSVANSFHGHNLMKAYKPERFQKVAVEGTPSAGGYLTVPQYFQELFAQVRGQGNAIRRYGWLNVPPTTSRTFLIPTGGGSTTVGWTPENTTKPTNDLTLARSR